LTFRGSSLHLTPMWFVPFLLLSALPVQGELKVTVEQSLRFAEESSAVLDVSYEIPNTSLAFLRDSGGFAARYEVSIQVLDKRRDVVAGDLWQKVVHYREYAPTVARDSVEAGTVSLVLPKVALDARVEVRDQGSERAALAMFRIERPTGGLMVRLYRSGKPVAMRKYGIGDTLVAVAAAANQQARVDSCRFVLKRDRRVVTGATIRTTVSDDSAGTIPAARFEYPIGDSAGVALLGGGTYALEVTGFGAGPDLHAAVEFRVEVPFFLDDSAYLQHVEQLVYVASTDELRRLRSVPRSEREQAWREFWRKREQTPIKMRYVNEEEYFERIGYAEEHFGHGDRGYLSDRGHVYVLYGAPDQIDSRPFEIDSPAYEVWYYYQINKEFDFFDRFGAGEYVLLNREEL
jgi:GWxTD domain-containing protein